MDHLLKAINADFKRIRDPIYGYIHLTEEEVKIVDTPMFQRLRRVHQLALTKYVYPTAEHSRFVHSIGVLNCATSMFLGMCDNSIFGWNEYERTHQLRLLRFAALLHDVGHLPFSHAAEEELLEGGSHEGFGQYIISNYKQFSDIIEDYTPLVKSILSGEMTAKYSLIHDIISGQLDADRADYLMRDSHACGVKYGEYDWNRYRQAFEVISMGNKRYQLCVKQRDAFVIEGFLMARYHYNLQVPYHRTRTGYDLVLCKYFKQIKEDGKIVPFFNMDGAKHFSDIDLDFFETFDDYTVYELIKQDYKRGNPWAKILLRLDHLRPVFDAMDEPSETGGTIGGADDKFKNLIGELEKAGLQREHDFFEYRKPIELSKLARRSDEGGGQGQGDPVLFVRDKDGKLSDIVDCSHLISKLNKPLTLYRIFAAPWALEKVAKVKEKVLGSASKYH